MKVVHYKRESYDVYIGRPSLFGNPFKIGRDGTRAEVIELYRQQVKENPYIAEALRRIVKQYGPGVILGCWCKPLPCHGDVLVELAREIGLIP